MKTSKNTTKSYLTVIHICIITLHVHGHTNTCYCQSLYKKTNMYNERIYDVTNINTCSIYFVINKFENN